MSNYCNLMIKLNFKESNSVLFSCCPSAPVWAGQVCLLLSTTSFSTSEITILWIFMAWWQSCAARGCVWYRIWWVLPQIKYCILSLWLNFTNQREQTKEKKEKCILYFILTYYSGAVVVLLFTLYPAAVPSPWGMSQFDKGNDLAHPEQDSPSWKKTNGNLSSNYPNHPLHRCLPCQTLCLGHVLIFSITLSLFLDLRYISLCPCFISQIVSLQCLRPWGW